MPGLAVGFLVLALALLAGFRIATDAVGPDPAKWLLHQTGFWALIFLSATLAVSTLRRLIGKPLLVRWRRPFGIAGFAVATGHVLVYVTVFHGLELAPILDDIGKRPYIMIGMAAWLLLLPLAATSTQSARRRLGPHWTLLHRAVYVIVPLAILHQGMAQKADLGQTLIFSALAVCFLSERWLAVKGLLPWVPKRPKTNVKVG